MSLNFLFMRELWIVSAERRWNYRRVESWGFSCSFFTVSKNGSDWLERQRRAYDWLFDEENSHAYLGGEWSAAPMKLICVGVTRPYLYE